MIAKIRNAHIATNIVLKIGLIIMGHNLLNAANMALCARDLRYSAFCLSCITAYCIIVYRVTAYYITMSAGLVILLNNQAMVEYITLS